MIEVTMLIARNQTSMLRLQKLGRWSVFKLEWITTYSRLLLVKRYTQLLPINCLFLNIRGIGEDAKVRWVRSLMALHKINFLGLQET